MASHSATAEAPEYHHCPCSLPDTFEDTGLLLLQSSLTASRSAAPLPYVPDKPCRTETAAAHLAHAAARLIIPSVNYKMLPSRLGLLPRTFHAIALCHRFQSANSAMTAAATDHDVNSIGTSTQSPSVPPVSTPTLAHTRRSTSTRRIKQSNHHRNIGSNNILKFCKTSFNGLQSAPNWPRKSRVCIAWLSRTTQLCSRDHYQLGEA